MDEKKVYTGFGVLVVILLLVGVFRSGSDSDDALAAMRKDMTGANDAIAALGERLDGIESRIEEVAASADATGDLDALRAQIAEVAETASASLSERMAGLEADLAERFAGVEASMGEMAEAARSVVAAGAVDDAATEDAATTATTEAADDSAPADGLSVGQTLIAADGALRVFVSRVAGDEARLLVNGRTKTLGEGGAVTVPAGDDYCRVSVDAALGGKAALSAICGDDLPPPEGISVGNTAIFEDGALRSFVSLVGEDSARLSVNGDLVTLAVGRSVAAMAGDERCRVSLDAVDRGHASLSAACGDALPVSDAVLPGGAAVFDDGAARVFVVALDGDAVRYAVNGQTVVSGVPGDGVDLGGGCKVTVEEVSDAGAVFSHGCE